MNVHDVLGVEAATERATSAACESDTKYSASVGLEFVANHRTRTATESASVGMAVDVYTAAEAP